jgi:hypothetical protein
MAHVIIVPEHPGDEIDHADGNVRFLDHNTVLINELKPEYTYWKDGIEKIREDFRESFHRLPSGRSHWRCSRGAGGIYGT